MEDEDSSVSLSQHRGFIILSVEELIQHHPHLTTGSATLISIGILYEGSEHPQTLQILLGEIKRRSGGDNVLEREGYAIAAGSALGLVALGGWEDASGFIDTLVGRLFQYICGKEYLSDRSFTTAPSVDDHHHPIGQSYSYCFGRIPIITSRKKFPVGQELNKAAMVTLLNIKCTDKKTRQQDMNGVRDEKYKEMLMKKVHHQGAEFVSYDPIKGEWKFRLNHF